MFNNKHQKKIKIVFSGGPGVGKTTLLNALAKKGYAVSGEVFTDLYANANENQQFEALFEDKATLVNKLIDMQLKEEDKHLSLEHECIFLDRSMIDILGFCDEISYSLTSRQLTDINSCYYDYCFVPEPMPAVFYEQNAVRRQSYTQSLVCHSEIIQYYKDYFINTHRDPSKHIFFIPSFIENENATLTVFSDSLEKRILFIRQQLSSWLA